MSKRRLSSWTLVCITWFAVLGQTGLPAFAREYPDPNYLSKTEIIVENVIAAPPAEGTPGDRLDIDEMLKIQKSRTKSDCERAQSEAEITFKGFFGKPYGPLSDEKLKAYDNIFERTKYDADYMAWTAKQRWARKRPFVEHKEINPCVTKPTGLAYPSGHATVATATARMLAFLEPSLADDLKKRGNQIAFDRVLGGVHHPSDIAAGKKLGEEVFAHLMANRKFRAELEAVKTGSAARAEK